MLERQLAMDLLMRLELNSGEDSPAQETSAGENDGGSDTYEDCAPLSGWVGKPPVAPPPPSFAMGATLEAIHPYTHPHGNILDVAIGDCMRVVGEKSGWLLMERLGPSGELLLGRKREQGYAPPRLLSGTPGPPRSARLNAFAVFLLARAFAAPWGVMASPGPGRRAAVPSPQLYTPEGGAARPGEENTFEVHAQKPRDLNATTPVEHAVELSANHPREPESAQFAFY